LSVEKRGHREGRGVSGQPPGLHRGANAYVFKAHVVMACVAAISVGERASAFRYTPSATTM
jgi:hypothetical protein